MGQARSRSLTLDAGALIALERGNHRVMALLKTATQFALTISASAGVLAQLWRASARQATIARILKDELVQVPPLDRKAALQIGSLLASRGSSDVVDAHVALLALATGSIVITSDPHDIRVFAPDLQLATV